MNNIFSGVKVVDFSINVAGPVTALYLADFGADVVKVERPGVGDDARSWSPFIDGTGIAALWMQRGKRSLSIDLGAPEGVAVARKLVAGSDVIIESFRPGTMQKWGLDYESIKTVNPKVIMCSISAFGQTGPDCRKPGYDVIVQGTSGLMDQCGEIDGPPMKSGALMGDYTAAYHAFGAISAALYHREKTGIGQYIDISMNDCLVAMNYAFETSVYNGAPFTRNGNHSPRVAPFGVYRHRKGYIVICCGNQKLWVNMCKAIGKEEWIDFPEFENINLRAQNLPELVACIESWMNQFEDIDEFLPILQNAGIPAERVVNTTELVDSPQLLARNMIKPIRLSPMLSKSEILARGNPIKFSEARCEEQAAPVNGEHTIEVLRALGYSRAEIDGLYDSGVAFSYRPAEKE